MINKKLLKWTTVQIQVLLSILMFLSFCLSCTSVPPEKEWTGETLFSKDWTLKIQDKNKAVLRLPFKGSVEIFGEAYNEEEGNWVFYTDSLHLLFNWNDGWTDTLIALQGVIRLSPDENKTWTMSIIETPEIGSVLQGEIRFRRSKINGDRAMDLIGRRLARTRSVSDFIQSALTVSDFTFSDSKKGLYSKEFNSSIRKILFPEVYGFSRDFPQPAIQVNQTNRFVRKEEILWDTEYTSEYFPEELAEVRNSGTLFRDFEEASDLIFINCIWQELWKSIITKTAIQEY